MLPPSWDPAIKYKHYRTFGEKESWLLKPYDWGWMKFAVVLLLSIAGLFYIVLSATQYLVGT